MDGVFDFAQALAYLGRLPQMSAKLHLDRIDRMCELAGRPERRFRSVLVGGSAGKGSTCTFLAAILRAAGFRTGISPKPHLVSFCERIQVDGRLISEEAFATLLAAVVPIVETVTEELGEPSVFEVMTLLAFQYFAQAEVDWAVVEVGLGGRFDATNVLLPEISVITSIGLDHTDRLGDTVELIAFEKAGIVKPRGRLITGAEGGALRVIERMAAERGSEIRRLGSEIAIADVRVEPGGTTFDFSAPEKRFPALRTRLRGAHQAHNAALAAAAALWLRSAGLAAIPDQAVREGLETASIPGRLQEVRERPLVVLDGAHSPDRARALAEAVRTIYLDASPERRVHLVIGCSAGHAPADVVRCLAPLATAVYATRSRHPASVPAEEVAAAARDCGVPASVHEPVAAAVTAALAAARPEDLVLVTGSLFVAGEALVAIQGAVRG